MADFDEMTQEQYAPPACHGGDRYETDANTRCRRADSLPRHYQDCERW